MPRDVLKFFSHCSFVSFHFFNISCICTVDYSVPFIRLQYILCVRVCVVS